MAEMTPQADAQANRQPQIIVTDSYLNDPIQFTEDIRLTPETLLQSIDATIATRDEADFLEITVGGGTPRLCAITMITPLYDRFAIDRHIDSEIEELLNG